MRAVCDHENPQRPGCRCYLDAGHERMHGCEHADWPVAGPEPEWWRSILQDFTPPGDAVGVAIAEWNRRVEAKLEAPAEEHVKALVAAIDAAGLLVTPAHDAAVIEKFLRERDAVEFTKGARPVRDATEVVQQIIDDVEEWDEHDVGPITRGLIEAHLTRHADDVRAETLAEFTEETHLRWPVDETSSSRVQRARTPVRERRLVGPWEPDTRTREERSVDAINALRPLLTEPEPNRDQEDR